VTDNRQIDRLIAEHVMGLRIYHYDKDIAERCYYMLVDENWDYAGDDFGRHAGERETEAEAWEKDCPHYSTDISAAWRVVEKLGEVYDVVVGRDKEGTGFCRLYTDRTQDYYPRHEMFAETPQLAICLAALKCKGIDV
jgi:hypothetical protein